MCCVAIARRKYLRCNISAFSKYEVCSCITGQRSENRTPWSEQIICAPVQQKMFCSDRFRQDSREKKTERRKNTEKKPAWLFPTFSGENCHNRLIFETEGARLRRIKNSRGVDIFPVWKDTPKCTPNFGGTSMLLAGLCGTMIFKKNKSHKGLCTLWDFSASIWRKGWD